MNMIENNKINQMPQFKCVNCEKIIELQRSVKLFCSDLCKDEADYVRYYRRCILGGRINQMDIKEALNTKRAFLLPGGYDEKNRRLSSDIKNSVKAKYKGRCAFCGKPGL